MGVGCGCADCREYRRWRVEGTDEWQPKPDAWESSAASSAATSGRDVNSVDWLNTDSRGADSPYSPLA